MGLAVEVVTRHQLVKLRATVARVVDLAAVAGVAAVLIMERTDLAALVALVEMVWLLSQSFNLI
jgi:hypothetical protein